MPWAIKVKTSAKREIKKFDKPLQRQILEFLHQLETAKDPRSLLIPYTGPLACGVL